MVCCESGTKRFWKKNGKVVFYRYIANWSRKPHSYLICVLDPKYELAPVLPCQKEVEEGRAKAAQVQDPRGTRRKSRSHNGLESWKEDQEAALERKYWAIHVVFMHDLNEWHL